MRFKSGLVVMTSLLIGAAAFGAEHTRGSIVLVGQGAKSVAPEYVTLNVTVTSICYNTSQDAQQANAKLANRLLTVLEGFKKGDRDKVTATGGANTRQTEITHHGNESKVLCELKWRSENHLRIQMDHLADIPDLQDKLFAEIGEAVTVNDAVPEQTFAEVGKPNFGIFSETALRLRNEAQGLAYDDAKSQFNGLASRCAFVDPRLVSVTPPEFRTVFKSAGEAMPASYGSPVIPDEMEISATLRLEWEFTPSSACKTLF